MPLSQDLNYGGHRPGLDSPAANAAVITPSDTADLPNPPRALLALTDGTLRVTMLENGAVVDLQILAGVPLPLRVIRVHVTGTSATGLVGVW